MRPRFKSTIIIFSILLAVGFVLSTTRFYAAPANAQSSSVTLQTGKNDVAVSALQKWLIQQGYLSIGEPTGYFGSLTQAAVVAYQKAHGLTQTGEMSFSATGTTALFSSAATPFVSASIGDTGTSIQHIQEFLIEHGFLKISTATTYFGTLTQAAVIAYQRAHHLPQTGIVDQATFAVMNGFGSITVATGTAIGGGQGQPIITSLLPTSGAIGTQVTIVGSGFGVSNTVLFGGLLAASGISSNGNGTALTFSVPQTLMPNCVAGSMCPNFVEMVHPGTYSVSVMANGTTSNSMPFTVTSPPVATTTSGAITITSPAGGESWAIGSTHTVTWNGGGGLAGGNVSITLIGSNGVSDVFANVPNAGSYAWTIGNQQTVAPGTYTLTVAGFGGCNNSMLGSCFSGPSGTSQPFTITSPVASCLPSGVTTSTVVSVDLGGGNLVTVGQQLGSLGASCQNGQLMDSNGRWIKFYNLTGCWGNEPSNYQQILANQEQAIQSLQAQYTVITLTCNPGGAEIE